MHNFAGDRETWGSLNSPKRRKIMFSRKYKEKKFLWKKILTDSVFLTQRSSNVGTSVWRILWVTTNCSFLRWTPSSRSFWSLKCLSWILLEVYALSSLCIREITRKLRKEI
jgi:hypothetical protein